MRFLVVLQELAPSCRARALVMRQNREDGMGGELLQPMGTLGLKGVVLSKDITPMEGLPLVGLTG